MIFILQIDCLDSFVFGKNNTDKEVKKFANEYLKPYVNIISIGYLLGRNKKGIVGEVWWVKRKIIVKNLFQQKRKKAYSSEELLRLGKEKNNMDFVRVEKKK